MVPVFNYKERRVHSRVPVCYKYCDLLTFTISCFVYSMMAHTGNCNRGLENEALAQEQ
jgi:hypothetical protein